MFEQPMNEEKKLENLKQIVPKAKKRWTEISLATHHAVNIVIWREKTKLNWEEGDDGDDADENLIRILIHFGVASFASFCYYDMATLSYFYHHTSSIHDFFYCISNHISSIHIIRTHTRYTPYVCSVLCDYYSIFFCCSFLLTLLRWIIT